MKTSRVNALCLASAVLLLCAALALPALIRPALAGLAETRVILDGKPVAVHFNDGDSFRVLTGSKKGARARLVGFNTLESHGPVHQWGTWTARELYFMAKIATLHARRGVWKCQSVGDLDTYGRLLLSCPGLGEELIRLGYAHALSINDEPASAAFLAAQKEAIAARRGLWAHGVPAFVLTSLHSSEEDINGRGTYNRLVSTQDGHSVMWRHDTEYQECQNVCQMVYSVDDAKVAELTAGLRADSKVAEVIQKLSDEQLTGVVRDFAIYRHINRLIARDKRAALKQVLDGYVASGALGEQDGTPGCCMIHVPFKRRYGTGKASCLKQ